MGLANDLDTRVALANKNSLAQLDRNANNQRFGIDQQYNANVGNLQDQIANFDAAGKTQSAYQSLFKNALEEAKYNPQLDMIKAMFPSLINYTNNLNDNDTKTNLKNADLAWDAYKYGNLSASDQTKYAQDFMKMMGMDGQGNLTEYARHNRTTEALTDQGQKMTYAARMAGIQAGLQRAAMAGARASSASGPKPTQSDRDRVIGQDDIEIFLRNIDPSKDSRSSSQKLIDQARAGRKIDAEGYKILSQANNAFWDEQDNRKAAVNAAGAEEYRLAQEAANSSFADATGDSTIPLYVDNPYFNFGN
jgi:hypothetical protein